MERKTYGHPIVMIDGIEVHYIDGECVSDEPLTEMQKDEAVKWFTDMRKGMDHWCDIIEAGIIERRKEQHANLKVYSNEYATK